MTPEGRLEALVGEELSGVVFVRDYIQLQFNPPPIMTVDARVTVVLETLRVSQGQTGFADALIGQIGKTITRTTIDDEPTLRLMFNDGSSIEVSPGPEPHNGPEMFCLVLSDGTIVVE